MHIHINSKRDSLLRLNFIHFWHISVFICFIANIPFFVPLCLQVGNWLICNLWLAMTNPAIEYLCINFGVHFISLDYVIRTGIVESKDAYIFSIIIFNLFPEVKKIYIYRSNLRVSVYLHLNWQLLL